ncbi:hypothetical protein [Bacteroides caecigallinarum]|uniref:hypothetical protein n=1 Tax=Bacteroides caecigallinarum TaxID=1411144 RepID=UPI00374D1515
MFKKDALSITIPYASRTTFRQSTDCNRKQRHIICEVTDDSSPSLTKYRHVIIEAEPYIALPAHPHTAYRQK